MKVELTVLRAVLMSRDLVTQPEMVEALKTLSAASAIEWAVGDLRDVEAFQAALARIRGERPGEGADPASLG